MAKKVEKEQPKSAKATKTTKPTKKTKTTKTTKSTKTKSTKSAKTTKKAKPTKRKKASTARSKKVTKRKVSKRLTKSEYLSKLWTAAVQRDLTFKTDINRLPKVIKSTKIEVGCPVCGKARRTTVGAFLDDPDCQYCKKVGANQLLVSRRLSVYSSKQPSDKSLSPAKKLPKEIAYGPLKQGVYKVNRKPSKGESEVARVLEKLRAPYEVEKPIYLSKMNKKPLRADFTVELRGRFYIIEYDGEGHFMPELHGYRALYRRMRLDEAKDRWVARHANYSILRIPYWEFNNIEYLIREYLPL